MSGDEAKVRAIARHWLTAREADSPFPVDFTPSAFTQALTQAYAAGKADGAREEREACVKLIGELEAAAQLREDIALADEIADAIARRGSEG